jgi:hypothetical protein
MAAGIYNFTIEQGTTFQRTFKYKNADGTPKSLTGAEAIRMQIRPSVDSDTVIATYSKETDGGFEVATSPDNQFTLTITATQTSAFNFTNAVYDIEIEQSDVVTRLLQGKIKLSKEVTRD